MPFVKIMIHAVWGTKSRQPLLIKSIKEKILSHIKQNAKEKGIYIDTVNCVEDHIHLLFGLNADLSLAKTMQLIKGESSFWINKENITTAKFEWADEYYAASVSESQLQKVRDYITNQEAHHYKKTFTEECDEFLLKFGFSKRPS
jgi:putative transposase